MGPPEIIELIERLRTGDASAVKELTPTLYDALRKIASRHLRNERPNHTLQATALVHEAYLKLAGPTPGHYADDVHFLAVASRVMRQVLVDYARARATEKRAGHLAVDSPWTATIEFAGDSGVELCELIALNAAIDELAAENESIARLVEMRYFAGMTAEESAEALRISVHVAPD